MQSKQQNIKEIKIEGMRKFKEIFEAAEKAGKVKYHKIKINKKSFGKNVSISTY